MHPAHTRWVLTIAATVITVSVLVLMLLIQRLALTALEAGLVGSRLRASEVFARWGGEEFVILAPNTDARQAAHLAEEIRSRVATHSFPEVGQVTISLGVTQYALEDSRDSLLKRADAALYRAKAGGRNRVEAEPGTPRSTIARPCSATILKRDTVSDAGTTTGPAARQGGLP